MGGTRGSGYVSSADDVLEMSGVGGLGGVCELWMCLAQGGRYGVSDRIGFYQSCKNRGSG